MGREGSPRAGMEDGMDTCTNHGNKDWRSPWLPAEAGGNAPLDRAAIRVANQEGERQGISEVAHRNRRQPAERAERQVRRQSILFVRGPMHKPHFIANPQISTRPPCNEDNRQGARRPQLTQSDDPFSQSLAKATNNQRTATGSHARFQAFFRQPSAASGVALLVLLALTVHLSGASAAAAGVLAELLAGFQSRGITVKSDHPRCRERGLEGLYVRGSTALVICPQGDRSITLRHEGWHLVQSLCLAGRPWLEIGRAHV